jgi:hypothetical protein
LQNRRTFKADKFNKLAEQLIEQQEQSRALNNIKFEN